MIKTFASYNNTLSIGCVYAMYSLSMIQSKRAQTIQLWTNCLPNENPQRTESRQRKTEWFFMPPIAYIKYRTVWENFSCERERAGERKIYPPQTNAYTNERTNERLWMLRIKRICERGEFIWTISAGCAYHCFNVKWPKSLNLFIQRTTKEMKCVWVFFEIIFPDEFIQNSSIFDSNLNWLIFI